MRPTWRLLEVLLLTLLMCVATCGLLMADDGIEVHLDVGRTVNACPDEDVYVTVSARDWDLATDCVNADHFYFSNPDSNWVAVDEPWNDDYSFWHQTFKLHIPTGRTEAYEDCTFIANDLDWYHTEDDGEEHALVTINVKNVIHVKPGGNNASGGLTWDTAKATIQGGLDTASSGGEVWVAGGIANPYEEAIILADGVDLYGGFAGTEVFREERNWTANETTIRNQYFNVMGESLTEFILDGFALTGGSHGIFLEEASGEIRHCSIAENGGYGLDVSGGTSLTVADCTIAANVGSGLSADACANLVIEGCTIKNNCGSGMALTWCDSTITGNIICGNGMYAVGAAVPNGGGVSCGGGSITLTNNRITGNAADDFGGGVYANDTAPVISHNLIIGNWVLPRPNEDDWNSEGGGVALKDCTQGGLIDGNLFAHNTVGDHGAAITYEGANTNASIINNVFIHNQVLGNLGGARGGGAVNIFDSSPVIANDTFLFNDILLEPWMGGGAVLQASGSTVANCIFMGNETVGTTGGAVCGGSVSYCDFYQNSAPAVINALESYDVTTDPKLTDTHYVMQLEDWSSCSGLATEATDDPDGGVDEICSISNDAYLCFQHLDVPDTEYLGHIPCHLGVRYNLPSGAVAMNIFVDNATTPLTTIPLAATSGWVTKGRGDLDDINIPSGSHSLKITFTDVVSGEDLRVNWIWLDYCPLLNTHLVMNSPGIDTGRNSLGSPNMIPSTDYDDDERPIDGNGDLTATTDRGADEWKYTLCSTAADVEAKAAGAFVFVNGWHVTSVSPHWLGVSEFVLQDAYQQPITIEWSGSPPVVGQTLGAGGSIDVDPLSGACKINALSVW